MLNLKILIVLIIFTTNLLANTIHIDDETNHKELLSSSEILIDKTKLLTIEDIKKNKNFIKNTEELLGFGYSPNFNVWIKFTIHNNSNFTLNKIIEYNNSLTTNIEFYNYNNDKYIKQKEGLYSINKQRYSLNPIFNITLKANESKVYYIKTSSHITTLIIDLILWESKSFYKKEMQHQLILALFFGAMTILAIYNFFIYFFTKDINYLFYVLYVVGITIHQLMYIGIAHIYILNQTWVIYSVHMASMIVSFPILALAFLIKSFLQIKQYPFWNKVLNTYLIMYPILTFILLLMDDLNNYRHFLPIILLLFLMTLTIYSASKKNRQAFIVLIGWFMFVTACLFMYLSSLGIYNIYDIFPYYTEFALIFEAIIFSIALTDKIKQLQKNKNEANMKLILQKELETTKLTNIVNKKTHHLKLALEEKNTLLKELNHRVKNNMQTIVSLIHLQSKETKNKKLKDIFTTIQNRIKAMSHLHELLYHQDNIAYINAYDYFNLLIKELNDSYDKKINIDMKIKANLKVEQSVYCGLILNELVTNSFKYAFINNIGDINITLIQEEEKYILDINDNGIGYEKQDNNTLGLILVNTLVTDQLDGKITIDSKDGVKVHIEWK